MPRDIEGALTPDVSRDRAGDPVDKPLICAAAEPAAVRPTHEAGAVIVGYGRCRRGLVISGEAEVALALTVATGVCTLSWVVQG